MLLAFLTLALVLCSSCSTFVYVGGTWPKLYKPDNAKSTVTFSLSDLDPLGEPKKKEIVTEITGLVAYIKTLEATLDSYNEEAAKHNAKFKEKAIGKKETSP